MKINRTARLISQVLFFLLFVFFIIKSEFSGFAKGVETSNLPYPVGLFLDINPLIAINTILSTHTLYHHLLPALITVLLTLFLGRFFCGWICPLGTINHFISSFKTGVLKGKKRLDTNQFKTWQKLKYYILIFFIVSSFFTTIQIGLLDPICLVTRTFGTVIIPTISYTVISTAGTFISSDIPLLSPIGSLFLSSMQHTIVPYKALHFNSTFIFALIFIAIIISNRYITRFWCRSICPLGALLGVTSRFSIFGLQKKSELCNNCNKCELYCQGGDNPMPGKKWHKAECHLCLNCVGECSEKALQFKFFYEQDSVIEKPDLTKRHVITSLAAGAVAVPLLRSEAGLEVNYNHKLIRPPGSLEEKDFLARCVKCGLCMKVCPNNAIHPNLFEAGIEGLWSPIIIPRIGYCEPSCTICSTICPSGAISQITPKEKGWISSEDGEKNSDPIKIGLACVDRGRCLPWAMKTQCIVCEEWCPTSPKAIYLDETGEFKRNGEYVYLKRPIIDPQNCVGCGACESACPIEDKPAIFITSIGESRSKTNQILLKSGK